MKEFTFKTKYELGEKVFAYKNRASIEGEIRRIDFSTDTSSCEIWYFIGDCLVNEEDVYPSKEDFIKTLTPCE
jgi:hypothetical protein